MVGEAQEDQCVERLLTGGVRGTKGDLARPFSTFARRMKPRLPSCSG